jgi:hypothetical protein
MPALTALTSRWNTTEKGLTMGLSNSAMSLGRIAGPCGVASPLTQKSAIHSGAVLQSC